MQSPKVNAVIIRRGVSRETFILCRRQAVRYVVPDAADWHRCPAWLVTSNRGIFLGVDVLRVSQQLVDEFLHASGAAYHVRHEILAAVLQVMLKLRDQV